MCAHSKHLSHRTPVQTTYLCFIELVNLVLHFPLNSNFEACLIIKCSLSMPPLLLQPFPRLQAHMTPINMLMHDA